MKFLKRLGDPALRSIAIYGLATGLAAVLNLLLTRVLWYRLSPTAFGIWALVDPIILPTASLVLLGIDHSIVKQLRVDRLTLSVVTGTLLFSTLPASLLLLVVTGLVARFALRLDWTSALVLTMAGEALILMLQTAFRAAGLVGMFSIVLLSRNALYLGVLVATSTVWNVDMTVGEIFLIRGLCVSAVGLLALPVLKPVFSANLDRYCDALKYGLPLLATTFIYALSDMTDRWFLAEFRGMVDVGVYSLHLKIAAILSQALVVPFGLWFPPERFKRLEDPDGGQRFFIRTAAVLGLVCGYLSGGVWLARDVVLSLIAPGAVSSPVVLACCLATVICLAMSQALNVGLLNPGHTKKNPICNACAAAVELAAAAVAVPAFGLNGAAFSRVISGVVLVGITAFWSQRVHPVMFPVKTIVLYFGTSALAVWGIDAFALTNNVGIIVAKLAVWTAITGVLGGLFWIRIGKADRSGRQFATA